MYMNYPNQIRQSTFLSSCHSLVIAAFKLLSSICLARLVRLLSDLFSQILYHTVMLKHSLAKSENSVISGRLGLSREESGEEYWTRSGRMEARYFASQSGRWCPWAEFSIRHITLGFHFAVALSKLIQGSSERLPGDSFLNFSKNILVKICEEKKFD